MLLGWNNELLQSTLLAADIEVIESIPIGRFRCADYLIWHYDNKGRYSVKSGYFRAMEERYGAHSSRGCADRRWC